MNETPEQERARVAEMARRIGVAITPAPLDPVRHTDDPNDPRVKRGGPDTERTAQHETYLVLSVEERARGFIRPVRTAYRHVGTPGPKYPLRDLTDEERERYANVGYVKFEKYPPERSPIVGTYWTQAELDNVNKGCGTTTTMGRPIAETYARNPQFYGSTYCVQCAKHLAVGERGEFVWLDDGSRVGT